ncbi:alpha/beta fold hydrolase [Tumebacillus avium]|nr:alpha/beta hydrolase [Tumebacillus avium]
MLPTMQHTIDVSGTRLAVYEWSQTGDPVVFLHFLNGNASTWNGVIPFFEKEYRAIGIDLRGHGRSDQPESGYDLPTLAADVAGVLDALGIDSAHFVGSSLGCHVALQLASEYPERVRSLAFSDGALSDASCPNGEEVTLEEVVQPYMAQPLPVFDSVDDYLIHARERYGELWNETRERAVRDGYLASLRRLPDGKLTFKTSKETELQVIEGIYRVCVADLYARVQCPVLFLPAAIHRFYDFKLEHIARLQQVLTAHSKVVVIPNTMHVMVYDFAEELSREILAFYQEIGA